MKRDPKRLNCKSCYNEQCINYGKDEYGDERCFINKEGNYTLVMATNLFGKIMPKGNADLYTD